MAQLTIYLDTDTEEKLRAFVKTKNTSQSKWVAGLIREKLQSAWPDHVADLAGAWKDLPTLEEIRAESALDTSRESL